MGCRKRNKKPRGFSEPWSKPAYDLFTNMVDVHGPEKRGLLNVFSLVIAFSMALSSGIGGCFFAIETVDVGIVSGWIIGLIAGVAVFNLAMHWLEEDRYYRP